MATLNTERNTRHRGSGLWRPLAALRAAVLGVLDTIDAAQRLRLQMRARCPGLDL